MRALAAPKAEAISRRPTHGRAIKPDTLGPNFNRRIEDRTESDDSDVLRRNRDWGSRVVLAWTDHSNSFSPETSKRRQRIYINDSVAGARSLSHPGCENHGQKRRLGKESSTLHMLSPEEV